MKYIATIAAAAAVFLPLSAFADTTPTATVTIALYVDGVHATAANTDGLSVPMVSLWSAQNIGHSHGAYALSTSGFNSPNAYEAVTSDMSLPFSYSTRADIGWGKNNSDGKNISGNCATGDPLALDGYSVGDTLTAAEAAGPAIESWDVLDHASSSKYMIVWAHHCLAAPTITSPKNGASLTQSNMTGVAWSSIADNWGTVSYIYESVVLPGGKSPAPTNKDGSFVNPAYTSGLLSGTSIPTPGTPPGVYYIHVKAVDNNGNSSWWSNPIKVTVTPDSPVVSNALAD